MIIYLDVDGVCADIHQSLADFLGIPYSEIAANCEKGRYDQPYLPEVYDGCIWEYVLPIVSETFWSKSPDLPWFPVIVRMLREIAPVVYLTSVSYSPQAASGRVKWMLSKNGDKFRDFVITSRKELLAHPGAVLVDDCDKNLRDFTAAGGHAVRVPQRWNIGVEGPLIDHRPSPLYVLDLVLNGVMRAKDEIDSWAKKVRR